MADYQINKPHYIEPQLRGSISILSFNIEYSPKAMLCFNTNPQNRFADNCKTRQGIMFEYHMASKKENGMTIKVFFLNLFSSAVIFRKWMDAVNILNWKIFLRMFADKVYRYAASGLSSFSRMRCNSI